MMEPSYSLLCYPSSVALFLPFVLESIAPAHMSPDTELRISLLNPNSICSLFPPARSLSGSSDSSLSNRSLIPDFNDYPSISTFFPPDYSPSSSVFAQSKHFSSYSITSIFPPIHSQRNSVSSETSLHGFDNSISSIFQPNSSFSPSIESAQYHYQFTSNESESSHKFKDVSSRTEPHFQGPNITSWRQIKFHFSDDNERIFRQQVEAEFEQAQEMWSYAIYWVLDRSSKSPSWFSFSPVKGFYNVDDQKFTDYNLASSFFQLMDSWSSSVVSLVYSIRNPIWLVGEDCLNDSNYYRAREGGKYGLKTMSWIRIADGVMEFGSTKLIYPPVSAQTEHSTHRQEPNISINSERFIPQQVKAEFGHAQERWSYGIYWELDKPSKSLLWDTFSPTVIKLYNKYDHKFFDTSFFQLEEYSWSNSIVSHVFYISSHIWLVGEDCLRGSKYYRSRSGHRYGLKTMYWIRKEDGVMEFGSTKLIHPVADPGLLMKGVKLNIRKFLRKKNYDKKVVSMEDQIFGISI